MKANYILLVNKFWMLNETWCFTSSETRLYFQILDLFNKSFWADEIKITDIKLQGLTGFSAENLKKSRKNLINSGLIQMRKGGLGRITAYQIPQRYEDTLTNVTDKNVTNEATTIEPTTNNSETTDTFVAQPTQYIRACVKQVKQKLKEKTLPNRETTSNQAEGVKGGQKVLVVEKKEVATPQPTPAPQTSNQATQDALSVPNDNTPRNFEGLCRRLRDLKMTRAQAFKVIKLSNFGEIGHKVWQVLAYIRDNMATLKAPIQFLFSRLDNQPVLC